MYRVFFMRSALYGIYIRVNLFKKRTRKQISKCEVCIKRPYKTLPINKFVHFIDTNNFFLFKRLSLSNLNSAHLNVKYNWQKALYLWVKNKTLPLACTFFFQKYVFGFPSIVNICKHGKLLNLSILNLK